MKLLIIFAFALLVTLSGANPLVEKWSQYKINHGKAYANYAEETKRLAIFKDNLKEIELHNELYETGKSSYKMGVNQFTDMTHEEFVQYLKTSPRPEKSLPTEEFVKSVGAVPESKDWRNEGAVGAVKNQGSCGSCWSFSTTGSLEGQEFLTTGKLIPLSEQELVDCSQDGGNAGCSGGTMGAAFRYVEEHGIVSEDDYPYDAADGTCKRGDIPATFKISSYLVIRKGNEADLKAAVGTVGPVSVAIDASNWQHYASGVFDDLACSSEALNHGVLAIGYGQEGGDFWIVKNSWGKSWGEQGYIKTKRNKNNQCGIATDASFPVA